jgi:hypothetical protein
MRVEQLIGNYSNPENRKRGKNDPGLHFSARRVPRPGAVVDMVCLSGDEFDLDLNWYDAYVRELPDDTVIEKIRQLYRGASPSDDLLIEKLMFEVF